MNIYTGIGSVRLHDLGGIRTVTPGFIDPGHYMYGRDGGYFMNPNLHDEIAKVVYDLYQNEGCREGRDLIHWLEVEKIVTERYAKVQRMPQAEAQPRKRLPGRRSRK